MKFFGWAEEVRRLGRITFIVLRNRKGKTQVVFRGKTDVKKEEALEIIGELKENPKAPGGKEIQAKEIRILGKVYHRLPVDPTGRTPSTLDTRLHYRFLDLRNPRVARIFEVKSKLINAFRRAVLRRDFVEIHPPTIVAAATEGGAELFPVQYFERKAYLAQSPQLYKQMAVVGGLERVFMTVPVFRAEKHNTVYHLNESWQMDVEMAFAGEEEALELLEDVFPEVVAVVKEPPDVVRVSYDEVVETLGKEWGEDLSREDEKAVWEKFGEAVIIRLWPRQLRPFYTMPVGEDRCLGYDLIYRGLEVLSGAQRIHDPELLRRELEARGLDPSNFEFYIRTFEFGAPPHAGWSIGLERLTMQVLGLANIREASLFPRDRTRLEP